MHTDPDREYLEPVRPFLSWRSLKRKTIMVGALFLLGLFIQQSRLDLPKLMKGVPRLASWSTRLLPPDLHKIEEVLVPALETLAMSTVGTLLALILAFPLAFLGARNTTPNLFVYGAVRTLFQLSRGTETLVFALIFVAAVGFGPFTGVLAIAFHSVGALGKLIAEVIEPADPGPQEAVALTGASRIKVMRYALLPDVMPNILSVIMYLWEFNVRTSTVLGIVGAGGIGQTLKDTIDLLDFPRMTTVLTTILLMVAGIDFLSARLRRLILQAESGAELAAPVRKSPAEPGPEAVSGVLG